MSTVSCGFKITSLWFPSHLQCSEQCLRTSAPPQHQCPAMRCYCTRALYPAGIAVQWQRRLTRFHLHEVMHCYQVAKPQGQFKNTSPTATSNSHTVIEGIATSELPWRPKQMWSHTGTGMLLSCWEAECGHKLAPWRAEQSRVGSQVNDSLAPS